MSDSERPDAAPATASGPGSDSASAPDVSAPVADASPSIGVAVVQFAPGTDRAANLAQIRELAARAAGRGATLVVFPEYSAYFAPEFGPEWLTAAEPLDGPFAHGLGEIAADLDVTLAAGFGERIDDEERFANTIVVVGPDGDIRVTARKLHLYDAFGAQESRWIVPGEIGAPPVFVHDGMTIGIQTCYDLRFPEVTRRLVDAGAQLVLVPSEWVRGPLKEAHWSTLIAARAIENTVYVAAADHTPPIGVGRSVIVDPMGVQVAGLGERTDVAVAWITADRVAEVRAVNPSLALRRFRVEPV